MNVINETVEASDWPSDSEGEPTQERPSVYEPLWPSTGRIVTIIGLPGSGKTGLATRLARGLTAVHINADFVRSTISRDLKFTKADRIRQAETMGTIARLVAEAGQRAVVDFVCPTFDTRQAYRDACGPSFHNRLDWIQLTRVGLISRFEDTNKLYEPLEVDSRLGITEDNFYEILNDGSRDLEEISDYLYSLLIGSLRL